MSLALAVIQPNPLQQCRRCGTCCESVSIPHPPAELRRRFEADEPYSNEQGSERRDIRTVYPMLKGRCRGKLVWGEPGDEDYCVRYVYGPCAHLSYEAADGKRQAKCALHGRDEKPVMCSGFPFYGGYIPLNEANPAYVRGCGYNLDPTTGMSGGEIEGYLWQLNDDEK